MLILLSMLILILANVSRRYRVGARTRASISFSVWCGITITVTDSIIIASANGIIDVNANNY